MDWFGVQSRKRQQTLLAALHAPALATSAAVAQTGPLQPHEQDHPGSDNYPYQDFTTGTFQVWHFKWLAIYPTRVTYLIPVGPLPLAAFPVIVVNPGKFLNRTDYYAHLLRHICRKGYVVLFVDPDTGPLDCQHTRMATESLEAIYKTIANKIQGRAGSPPQLAWWGHSMGAKVQALAAPLITNRYYLRPTAIIANNFSNDKGATGLCQDDALPTASGIPTDIWYTLIEGDQDTIAKDDPRHLYAALAGRPHRQLITGLSYAPDNLVADHDAPLTDPTLLPGVTARLDALDWWLYWKIAVGAFDYHFKAGPDKWAYGSERENGGTDLAGHMVRHRVEP